MGSANDLKLLDSNIIEACQDDDVDSDDDILASASVNCHGDLAQADKRVAKKDGTVNFCLLRNFKINWRTRNPSNFDRNGVPINKDEEAGRLHGSLGKLTERVTFHSCKPTLVRAQRKPEVVSAPVD